MAPCLCFHLITNNVRSYLVLQFSFFKKHFSIDVANICKDSLKMKNIFFFLDEDWLKNSQKMEYPPRCPLSKKKIDDDPR